MQNQVIFSLEAGLRPALPYMAFPKSRGEKKDNFSSYLGPTRELKCPENQDSHNLESIYLHKLSVLCCWPPSLWQVCSFWPKSRNALAAFRILLMLLLTAIPSMCCPQSLMWPEGHRFSALDCLIRLKRDFFFNLKFYSKLCIRDYTKPDLRDIGEIYWIIYFMIPLQLPFLEKMYIKEAQQTYAQQNEISSLSYHTFRHHPKAWHFFCLLSFFLFYMYLWNFVFKSVAVFFSIFPSSLKSCFLLLFQILKPLECNYFFIHALEIQCLPLWTLLMIRSSSNQQNCMLFTPLIT